MPKDQSGRGTFSWFIGKSLLIGVFVGVLLLSGCSSAKHYLTRALSFAVPARVSAQTAPIVSRHAFLGAFFRPNGSPPFGVFSVYSKQEAPEPTPAPTTNLFGKRGYCDAVSSNGLSISTGYLVDPKKLSDITSLGVGWTRTNPASFWDDHSHVDADVNYTFSEFDSAQCALLRQHIIPLIALEAGPVLYNAVPGQYTPKEQPHYRTASDFAEWCSAVTKHEREIFSAVHRYSMPGNEVNTNGAMFPEGYSQIAAFTKACYQAVKRIDPRAFVYGLELNMDGHADPIGMVKRLKDLGCGPGVCYDGLSAHLSLTYPIRPFDTPCVPNGGGDYSVSCLTDLRTAAGAPIHIILGETGYFVPGNVPDEATKALAIVAAMRTLATLDYVDGVSYANVDECDLYPNGFFQNGCLIDSLGTRLPGFFALQKLAKAAYK